MPQGVAYSKQSRYSKHPGTDWRHGKNSLFWSRIFIGAIELDKKFFSSFLDAPFNPYFSR
jgi:hypothetical protein